MCGEVFPKKTSYNSVSRPHFSAAKVNAHIDKCMQNPELAMHLKKNREMESKC